MLRATIVRHHAGETPPHPERATCSQNTLRIKGRILETTWQISTTYIHYAVSSRRAASCSPSNSPTSLFYRCRPRHDPSGDGGSLHRQQPSVCALHPTPAVLRSNTAKRFCSSRVCRHRKRLRGVQKGVRVTARSCRHLIQRCSHKLRLFCHLPRPLQCRPVCQMCICNCAQTMLTAHKHTCHKHLLPH